MSKSRRSNSPKRVDNLQMTEPRESPLKRWIRDHLDYPHKDYCLIWPFASKRKGYGSVFHNGRVVSAHRFMCELIHGPAPEGYVAAHSCNRGGEGCTNPHHLSWKTNSANQLDRTDRGKRSKLTKAKALEIRALLGQETPDVTAKRYGVSESAVRQVQSGKTWREDLRTRAADLAPEQVAAILRMKGRKTQGALAEEFEVSRSVVWRIHNGKTYRHVAVTIGLGT